MSNRGFVFYLNFFSIANKNIQQKRFFLADSATSPPNVPTRERKFFVSAMRLFFYYCQRVCYRFFISSMRKYFPHKIRSPMAQSFSNLNIEFRLKIVFRRCSLFTPWKVIWFFNEYCTRARAKCYCFSGVLVLSVSEVATTNGGFGLGIFFFSFFAVVSRSSDDSPDWDVCEQVWTFGYERNYCLQNHWFPRCFLRCLPG